MAKGRCESGGGNRTQTLGCYHKQKDLGSRKHCQAPRSKPTWFIENGLKLFLCTFSLVAFTSEKTEFRLVGCFLRERRTLAGGPLCADAASSSSDERQRNKQGQSLVSPGAEEKPSLEVLPLGLVNQSKGEGERKTSSVPAVCENQGLKGLGCICTLMIPPQVHLRRPCYDFSFLQMIRFGRISGLRDCYQSTKASPGTSPDHSIGRSDGRCVQRAGTKSARVDDSHLLGIPRLR
eukprot:TRINITY_DN138_c0_g1_i1.p1 TRINITY_DN138_c0_g1~~TRINITY_DN138_c0_g1_i1.p1  ORF type:complete len:235 (+),score=24.91 TRINITY_DN138_c0_g1_i1:281-985(+)